MNFNCGGAGSSLSWSGLPRLVGGREVMIVLSLSPFFVSVARVVFRCLCIHGQPADLGW